MKNVMVDIETMGLPPVAPICTIGAAFFDPKAGTVGPTFYIRVGWQGAHDQGVPVEQSTADWWSKQSPEATFEVVTPENRVPLNMALQALSGFLASTGVRDKDLQVWGNGDDFDCVLLESAYRRCGLHAPWMFWGTRDVRTLVQIVQDVQHLDVKRATKFVGRPHHALDDALYQIEYVCKGYAQL